MSYDATVCSFPCTIYSFRCHLAIYTTYYKNRDGYGQQTIYLWVVKGISTPLPEIINGTKQKLVKEKIKKYINGCY